MSTKQAPIFKHWFKTGSVAFVASCGCTLPFTKNIGNSALIGLATIPGVAVSTVARSRQRKQQIHRQLERGQLRLNELQQRGAILDRQLQLRDKDRQAIELRVSQLHSVAASLSDRLDRDRVREQQLEQQLSSLTDYYEEQQAVVIKLDRHIQEKQACLLEIDTELHSCKLKISQLQAEQIKIESSNDSLAQRLHQQAKIELKQIQSEIEGYSLIKQELELNIQQLQNQQTTDTELAAEIANRHNEIEMCDRSLKMARLELSSKQGELDNLDLKIQSRLQSIDEPDPWLAKDFQTIEPQPPTIDRQIEPIVVEGAWYDKFIDNPHLPVLQHIEKHGTITDAEASKKLGNARSVRQFANKLEAYTPDLPFAIRVESSPKGNRYLKETQN